MFVALAVTATSSWAGEAAKPGDEAARFFETEVRPLLVSRCYECHGPDSKGEGGLRLDSRAAALMGGDSGPAIVPGSPDESLLIDAVRYGDVFKMPPKSKLPDDEINRLVAWVRQGAAWPGDEVVSIASGQGRSASPTSDGVLGVPAATRAARAVGQSWRSGRDLPWIISSWPGSKRRGLRPPRRPTDGR